MGPWCLINIGAKANLSPPLMEWRASEHEESGFDMSGSRSPTAGCLHIGDYNIPVNSRFLTEVPSSKADGTHTEKTTLGQLDILAKTSW